MSEQFPVSNSPDSNPNFDKPLDILEEALAAGSTVRELYESGDDISAAAYGMSAADKINALIDGSPRLTTIRCSRLWLEVAKSARALTADRTTAVSGTLDRFFVLQIEKDIHLAAFLSHVTDPTVPAGQGFDQSEMRLIIPTSAIESYSYPNTENIAEL